MLLPLQQRVPGLSTIDQKKARNPSPGDFFRCAKVSEGLEHEMIYWLAHILLGCTNPSDTQERPHLMLMRALALLLIVPQDSEDQTERRDDIPQSGSMATLFHCMQISISSEAYNQSSVHSSE